MQALVSIGQCGKCSHFQPAQSEAASAATGMEARTSQFRSRMWISLEDGGMRGGRLLIGIGAAPALPSQGDHEAFATGSSKLNVDPSPGADSTQMSPFIDSTSSRQM